jgi:uncharacterized membrane-anchored protein YitT (DUF2179 family)
MNAVRNSKELHGLALDLLLILAGGGLMAVSIDVFLDPNDVVPGGFTAVAMFANRLWGWPVGLTVLLLNLPFLLLGMRHLGVAFGPKTVFTVAFVSAAIDLLKPLLPEVRGEPLLYILYGGLLFGLGQALVFRGNATSGGTETPAKLLEDFYGVRVSLSLFVMDAVILAAAAFVFGLAPALYALIASWVMARVIDFVESGLNATDSIFIISDQWESVKEAILMQMERGATLIPARGAYTGEERIVLFTVVSRREVRTVRNIVARNDPGAFVVVSPSNEVLGEGFRPLEGGRACRQE